MTSIFVISSCGKQEFAYKPPEVSSNPFKTACGRATCDIHLVYDYNYDDYPNVVGVKIHYGPTSGTYPYVYTHASHNKEIIINNLGPETLYFVITAYDKDGNESPHSEEKVVHFVQ
jgi:hypothetical protein